MVEQTLYVRNRRPNRVVVSFSGVRYVIERRGSREDSVSLPAEAANDSVVSRWLKTGILEKITKDQFMTLAARTVDVNPAPYLKRPVREQNRRDLGLHPAEADTTRSLTQISDKEVSKAASPNLEWAGDLMSTEEEIEEFLPEQQGDTRNYPSKHRDDS
jgi:hypothetical protein